jgi:hypothetical protein
MASLLDCRNTKQAHLYARNIQNQNNIIMKYTLIAALLLVLMTSCTNNYNVMYQDGRIEEVESEVDYRFYKGDTVIIKSTNYSITNSIYGKYISSVPKGDIFYYDSSMSIVNYRLAVILE